MKAPSQPVTSSYQQPRLREDLQQNHIKVHMRSQQKAQQQQWRITNVLSGNRQWGSSRMAWYSERWSVDGPLKLGQRLTWP